MEHNERLQGHAAAVFHQCNKYMIRIGPPYAVEQMRSAVKRFERVPIVNVHENL